MSPSEPTRKRARAENGTPVPSTPLTSSRKEQKQEKDTTPKSKLKSSQKSKSCKWKLRIDKKEQKKLQKSKKNKETAKKTFKESDENNEPKTEKWTSEKLRIKRKQKNGEKFKLKLLKQEQAKEIARKEVLISKSIYECAFLRPHSPGFTALSVSPDGQSYVAARTDHSLFFVRKTGSHWLPITNIPSPTGRADLSISCVMFTACGRYVTVARLDGTLSIFNVSSFDGLIPHAQLIPGGGALWDIAVAPFANKSFCLAVACDDGAVRIIKLDENYCYTEESEQSQQPELPTDSTHYIIFASSNAQGRALSVAWGLNDGVDGAEQSTVVCGDSEGGLRWIQINDMSCTLLGSGKIPVHNDGSPVLIWTVQTVQGRSKVVCGDDRGLVTVWSSMSMTMESEVAIEGVEGPIWCSAVINISNFEQVIMFGCANGSISGLKVDRGTWSHIRGRRMHSHDIRAISSAHKENKFMTASIDANIFLASPNQLVQSKSRLLASTYLSVMGQSPLVRVIKRPGLDLLMSMGSKELEFWQVPHGNDKELVSGGGGADLDEIPKLRLRMCVAGSRVNIRACAVSNDGCLVAVSDPNSFRLYRIWDGVMEAAFGKVEVLEVDERARGLLWGCMDVSFCGKFVVGIARGRQKIIIYDIEDMSVVGDFGMHSDIGSDGVYLNRIVCAHDTEHHKITVGVFDSRGCTFVLNVGEDVKESADWKWNEVNIGVKENGSRLISGMSISDTGNVIAVARADRSVGIVKIDENNGNVIQEITRELRFVATSLTIGKSEKNVLLSGALRASVLSLDSLWQKRQGNMEKREEDVNDVNVKMSKKRKREDKEIGVGKDINKPETGVPVSWEVPVFKEAMWGSGILSAGRIVLLRRRHDVMQSYLPDVIPKKVFAT